MVVSPQFLIVNNRLYLVSVTRQAGEITDVSGPYMCIGDPGATVDEFVKEFARIVTTAQHTSRPLALEDLPEVIRQKIATLDPPTADASASA